MTVILVDGPDGVGKTGYAEWIARDIGFRFLRMEPDGDFGELDGETIERMSSVFNETLVQLHEQGVDIVVDRGPISSIVYSEVFDRDEPDHAWKTIERLDPFIVYLKCDLSELKIRYTDDKFTNTEDIVEAYQDVMARLEPDLVIDTSSGAPALIQDGVHSEVVG